jgi:glycosyltransferase involved in cell wall biosynthesis
MSGMTSEQVVGQMKEFIANIKKSIHMYIHEDRYPPVIVVTESLSEHQMSQLHKACDVFVLPTKGEGWSPNMHDAMGFGNPVIASECFGVIDLYGEDVGSMMIPGSMTPCFGMVESFPDLYTGDEMWFEPDMYMLVSYMKIVYKAWGDGDLKQMGDKMRERAMMFNREKVGEIILETLRG